MNEHAGREKEIEARHQKEPDEYKGAVGYPSCAGCSANWPCDAAILLAQLREAREKLAAVEALDILHDRSYGAIQCLSSCPRCELDRILKGGD